MCEGQTDLGFGDVGCVKDRRIWGVGCVKDRRIRGVGVWGAGASFYGVEQNGRTEGCGMFAWPLQSTFIE